MMKMSMNTLKFRRGIQGTVLLGGKRASPFQVDMTKLSSERKCPGFRFAYQKIAHIVHVHLVFIKSVQPKQYKDIEPDNIKV